MIVSGSGDNPCGLAGLGLSEEGTVAVSLGTSDTIMGITGSPRPQEEVCVLLLLFLVLVLVLVVFFLVLHKRRGLVCRFKCRGIEDMRCCAGYRRHPIATHPRSRRPSATETRRWVRVRNNQGHIMVNPVEEYSCFAMLVYKNGSLVRERVRDEVRALSARIVCRRRAACFA